MKPDKNDGAGEIERHKFSYTPSPTLPTRGVSEMKPDKRGAWVRYTDHLARLQAVEAEREQWRGSFDGMVAVEKELKAQRDSYRKALEEIAEGAEEAQADIVASIARAALTDQRSQG